MRDKIAKLVNSCEDPAVCAVLRSLLVSMELGTVEALSVHVEGFNDQLKLLIREMERVQRLGKN